MAGRAGFSAGVALLAAILSACGTTGPSLIEPTLDRPVVACAVSCTDGGTIVFAHQYLCNHGKRQFRQIQIMGRVLDHWLVCAERDRKTLACTLGREYPMTDVIFGSCKQVTDGLQLIDGLHRGTMPGENTMGEPVPQH